jgi:hypothetical protein
MCLKYGQTGKHGDNLMATKAFIAGGEVYPKPVFYVLKLLSQPTI